MHEDAELCVRRRALAQSLLVRPKQALDESDVGYHIRLALANGLLPTYFQEANSVDGAHRLMGHLLPEWMMKNEWKKTSKVCISCLKESGVIKQSWRVKYVHSCVIHDEPLVMLLSKQGNAQSHVDTLRKEPSDLPNGPRPFEGEEADAHRLFKSVWPDLTSGVEPSAQSMGISVFLLSLLPRLTFARRGRDIQDKAPSLWVQIKRWATSNGIHVGSTVVACEKLLCELPTSLHQAVAIRWIEKLLNDEVQKATVLSALPLSDWLHRLKSLVGPIRISGRGALGGVAVEAMTTDGLPVKTASRQTGVSRRRLVNMMEMEGVQPIRQLQRTRRFLVIDINDVQRLAELAHERLTRVEATSALQISGHRFIMRALRLTGTVTHVRQQGHDFYKLSEIKVVLASLAEHAAPYEGQPSVSLADPAFYRNVDIRVVKQTLDAIKAGHLQAWHDPTAQGLRAIRVPVLVLNSAYQLSCCYRYGKRHHMSQLELPYAA